MKFFSSFKRSTQHLLRYNICFCFIISILLQKTLAGICTSKDYAFEYTTCDANGQRWKVAVPIHDGIHCDGLPAPIRGINCSFSCDAGMYLDIETQKCRPCKPGSYSLGGGIRFDEFARLPDGFFIENVDTTPDQLFMNTKSETSCPFETGWIIKNSELLYVRSTCLSKLMYSVNLVRPGYIDYVYRMPKNRRGLVFEVTVKNEQCQNYGEELRHFSGRREQDDHNSHASEEGEWQRRRLPLRRGANVITWSVDNSGDSASQVDVISIARIDVMGIAFTKDCTLCPPGTYSEKGAKECRYCAAGYFSTKGSAKCAQCPLSQYSGPRSSKCLERPLCTQEDYYLATKPCKDGKTQQFYKKVQPSICREDLTGSFQQPSPGPLIDCPKCNPGMSLDVNGQCVFCPEGHYSDGNECKKCDVGALPNYGFQYVLWHVLPANMESRCEYVTEASSIACGSNESWLPSGSELRTAPTYDKGVVLELVLNINEGFFNPFFLKDTHASAHNPIARITLDFETRCADQSCIFYFVEALPSQMEYQLIADFNGTQPRKSFSYSILSTRPTKFVFAFMRSRTSVQDDVVSDQAIIYAINVTNVAKNGGGASACLKCPMANGKCIRCLAGNYISEEGGECKGCPANTILNVTSDRVGLKSCIPCGPNLNSVDGVKCSINKTFELKNADNTTSKYDFSSIADRTFNATGVRVFAREGSSYFHTFNLTLFHAGQAKCTESFEIAGYAQNLTLYSEVPTAEGFVCRATALQRRTKNNNSSNQFLFVTPLLLGDELIAVTLDKEFGNIKLTDKLMDHQSSDAKSELPEIRFFYRSSSPVSELCPIGYNTVVTARCDPRHSKEPEAILPKECSDGTCDGCLYHIILITSLACPICTEDDYKEIRGECLDGTLTVHRIPARHCILSGAQNSERTESCSSLSFRLRMLMFGSTTTAIALCITVAHVCRKNRNLEYKYTKLAESKNEKNEYLPSAETCGIEEDDDEEANDRVFFAKGKKRFFGIGSKMRNNQIDDSEIRAFVSDPDDG